MRTRTSTAFARGLAVAAAAGLCPGIHGERARATWLDLGETEGLVVDEDEGRVWIFGVFVVACAAGEAGDDLRRAFVWTFPAAVACGMLVLVARAGEVFGLGTGLGADGVLVARVVAGVEVVGEVAHDVGLRFLSEVKMGSSLLVGESWGKRGTQWKYESSL